MAFKTYPFDSLGSYFSADIMAVYQGKWIFCMHRERATWEHPSGHIEEGETPLEAAKRELHEETGAIDFDMEPLCDYYIDGVQNGWYFKGAGQVYFARVHTLGALPQDSEMASIGLFESLPDALTYPILRECFSIALQKQQSNQSEVQEALPPAGVLGSAPSLHAAVPSPKASEQPEGL